MQERFDKENTINKVKEYINSLIQMIKNGEELPVNLTLDPNKQIEKIVERTFFSGHLFLKKAYYELEINKIFKKIRKRITRICIR